MARWTAKCWMGSASGYQDIEVSANTINGAKEQLQNIYGAQQIINLREVRNSGGSGGGGGTEISWTAIGLMFLLLIFLAYWWIIIPIGILAGLGWWFMSKD